MSDAVKANPGLYFGSYPAEDWPLIVAAWTAADLLRLAPSAPSVALVLREGGTLSATVRGAVVTSPSPSPSSVAEVIKSGMWYSELSRETVVTTSCGPDAAAVPDGFAWHDLVVTVHSTLSGGALTTTAGSWWSASLTRLAAVLNTPRHRPPDGQQIHVTNETTREQALLP